MVVGDGDTRHPPPARGTCQVLQAERAEVILEYARVTPLVAAGVNETPPLRSEKL